MTKLGRPRSVAEGPQQQPLTISIGGCSLLQLMQTDDAWIITLWMLGSEVIEKNRWWLVWPDI